MKTTRALLCTAFLACTSAGEAPKEPAPATPLREPAVAQPASEAFAPPLELAKARMLAMTGGRLLFWTQEWARVRDTVGNFGAPMQLPDRAWMMAVDGERLLAAGYARTTTAGRPDFEARLFDTSGKELGRWRVEERVRGVALDASGPRLLTEEGAMLLEANGKASAPIPYTPETVLPLRGDAWPFYFSVGDVTLYCLDNTPTKEYDFASSCARVSGSEVIYTVFERFRHPAVCGQWLVHVGRREASELHVRDLTTGKLIAKAPTKLVYSLVCDEGALYVLTEAGIERRALPTLKRRGKLARPKNDHVLDMALLPAGLVYRLGSTPTELRTMPPAP